MANTKISALTANTNPSWSEEFVFADNNANGKITLNTMKAFVGWAWVSTLNADANIWELPAGTYETTYDLYYKSWEKVTAPSSVFTKKQRITVTSESNWTKWFFVFNVWHNPSRNSSYACYWYSASSSEWKVYQLNDRTWALSQYAYMIEAWEQSSPDAISENTLTQVLDDVQDTVNNVLQVSSQEPPYPWMTYTIFVNSVKAGETYSMTLWTWVTNPLNITLPSSINKKCVITLLATSTTTAVVTGCTIAS